MFEKAEQSYKVKMLILALLCGTFSTPPCSLASMFFSFNLIYTLLDETLHF